ncbi:MAG TPA: amino acid ABC transporter permease [Ktedonobacterales bacterium]|nr:amino acid ABC transporter permease [Ktedonobacterales bacterium]
MRNSATLRFLALVAALVLVFGTCGSLTLGAFDKAQSLSSAPLFNLGNLFHFVTHFLQQLVTVITIGHDNAGTPFHNYFLAGVAVTIQFCFISMPLALLIGFVLALMSRSRLRIVRVPARTYVECFRNTPLIVQLLAIYTGLLFLPNWFLSAFTAGIATLVMNYAAYECENIRAGIEALDRGQAEGAAALGLNYWQTLRLITVPQIIAVVLPPVINDLIYMYKDSTILELITISELTVQASDLGRRFPYLFWQFYLVAALIYLVLSLPLGRLARWVEGKLRVGTLAPKRDLTVIAVQVLAGSLAFGWICGVLVQNATGHALGRIAGENIGSLIAAILLTLSLIAIVLVTLGGLVYLIGTPGNLLRRRRHIAARQAENKPAAHIVVVK